MTPGFIDTAIVKGWNATKKPAEGTVSLRHCLFQKLGVHAFSTGTLVHKGRASCRHLYCLFMDRGGNPVTSLLKLGRCARGMVGFLVRTESVPRSTSCATLASPSTTESRRTSESQLVLNSEHAVGALGRCKLTGGKAGNMLASRKPHEAHLCTTRVQRGRAAETAADYALVNSRDQALRVVTEREASV